MVTVNAIVANLLISIVSIGGFYWLYDRINKKILHILIGLSAGSMLGGAFLHLLPEAGKKMNLEELFGWVLMSFLIFFGMETWLHWRHCHEEKCKNHSFAYMNLLGDAIHNILDGLIIGAAFANSTTLGISTSMAVMLHEIPQEIGDMGVLVYSGISKLSAFRINFLISLTALVGVIVGVNFGAKETIQSYLLAMAGGGFLYIGASDLIPELRKKRKCIICLLAVVLGIGIMKLL